VPLSVIVPWAVLAVALAASPSPAPFAIGTLEPFAGVTPGPPLPNIGRVHAATPGCVAMRYLVIPSFAAARRADARFGDTHKRLPDYAAIVDDPEHRTDVYRESALTRLDADATALLGDAVVISRALGDPRLSRYSKDSEVLAERAELQRLYDAQKTRADLLEQFVIRQRAAIAKNGIDDNSAFSAGRNSPSATDIGVPYAPDPTATSAPDMPMLNGTAASDRRSLDDWATGIASDVHASEDHAAKTFLAIAGRCGASPAQR
jgi:hypothetical protein